MKKTILATLAIALVFAVALVTTACDPAPDNNGNKDTPQQNRTGTVALDRGLGTITVQVMGMTTQAEWNDIANKVKDSMNSGIEADISEYGEQDVVEVYKELFDRKVTYIVEPNPVGYSSYKLTGDGKTVYIALDKVDTKVPANVVVDLYQKNTMVDGVAVTPHQTTITAFDRDITVIGDAALSTADFNTAKGKLQEAMTAIDNGISPGIQRDRFINMLNRSGFQIIIKTGNAGPDADANKSMTIGIDYLLTTDAVPPPENTTAPSIAGALMQKVVAANAFADPTPPLYTNPATITQGTPNGLAFAGSVTIKSDDTYTPAAWDAVVANVITALNNAYEVAAFKDDFNTAFGGDGAQIFLVNVLSTNWEVKAGTTHGILYIKAVSVQSITTASYEAAVESIAFNTPAVSQANAAPPKRRAFLA